MPSTSHRGPDWAEYPRWSLTHLCSLTFVLLSICWKSIPTSYILGEDTPLSKPWQLVDLSRPALSEDTAAIPKSWVPVWWQKLCCYSMSSYSQQLNFLPFSYFFHLCPSGTHHLPCTGNDFPVFLWNISSSFPHGFPCYLHYPGQFLTSPQHFYHFPPECIISQMGLSQLLWETRQVVYGSYLEDQFSYQRKLTG